MSTESDQEAGGTVLNVYVPKHERIGWEQQADELDLELSRYVREMVKAGQRQWYADYTGTDAARTSSPANDLEDQIIEVLTDSEPLDFDDLVQRLTGNIEDRLDEELGRLEREDRIKYSHKDREYSIPA